MKSKAQEVQICIPTFSKTGKEWGAAAGIRDRKIRNKTRPAPNGKLE
jgi:hypothetical protein